MSATDRAEPMWPTPARLASSRMVRRIAIAASRAEAMLPGVGRSGRSETTLGTAEAASTPVSASVNDHTRPRGHTGAPGGAPQVRELGGLPTKHAAYTTESSLERACTSQTPSEQAKHGPRFGIRRWL